MERRSIRVEVRDHGRRGARELDRLLRELAELDAAPWRAISAFFDVRWNDEQQRERARLSSKRGIERLRAGLGDGEADAALARDLERLETLVEERVQQAVDPSDSGVAIFLCGPRGLELAVRSAVPFADLVVAGPTAILRPLLRALPPRHALVAAIDRTEGRIWAIRPAALDPLGEVPGEVPRHHRSGGWQQLHLQRWSDGWMEKLEQETAETLDRLVEVEAPAWVVLLARPDLLAAVRRRLSPRVRRLLLPREADPGAPLGDLAASAEEELAAAQRRALGARIVAADEAARAGGAAATGIAAVIRAANEGRLRQVVIARDLCRDGWRCARCALIGERPAPIGCPACGGPVGAEELGEAIVRRALGCDAEVAVADGEPRLARLGGVVASLRY